MSNDLTTTGPKELLSPAQQAILDRAKPRPRPPRVPELRLYNTMMDVPGVERGTYFLQKYNPDTKKNDITPIGPNPSIVILRKLCSYSYYNEKQNRLVAWTSDIYFNDPNMVYLFRNDGEKSFVECSGPYPQVKEYMTRKYTAIVDGDSRKLMKFTNILYVLYEGNVYRMFVSNASAAGVLEDGKNADFSHPLPDSLLKWFEETGCDSTHVPFEFICELGSVQVTGKKQFYLMTFKQAGTVADFPAMIDTYARLENDLSMLLKMDVERMGITAVATEAEVEDAIPMPVNKYSSEDLPFDA